MYPLLEREMVEMIASLAKKVVRTELESKADGIREIVRMAIESVLDRETLTVKVHPDDHKELQDYGQELIQLFHEIKNVSFEAHASVAPGHCVVESNFGTVEAGLDHLDQQIDRILHLAPPGPSPAEQPGEANELDDMAGSDADAGAATDKAAEGDDDITIELDEPDEPVDPDEPESPA
jgi:hypothetical protein